MASGLGNVMIRPGSVNPFELEDDHTDTSSMYLEEHDSFDLSGLSSNLGQQDLSAISLITTSSLGQTLPSRRSVPHSVSGTTLDLDDAPPSYRRSLSWRSSNSVSSSASSFKLHRRHDSSIHSLSAVGGFQPPPVSMHNMKTYSRTSLASGRVRTRSQTTGQPDWNRHKRQESSMSSNGSYLVDLDAARPGLGVRNISVLALSGLFFAVFLCLFRCVYIYHIKDIDDDRVTDFLTPEQDVCPGTRRPPYIHHGLAQWIPRRLVQRHGVLHPSFRHPIAH